MTRPSQCPIRLPRPAFGAVVSIRAVVLIGAVALTGSVSVSSALAQDGGDGAEPAAPPPSAQEVVREAFAKLVRATKRHNKLAAKAEEDPSVRGLLGATARAHQRTRAEFTKAFEASDWDAWDPATDGDLLAHGLIAAGSRAYLVEPPRAVRALELLLAKTPDVDVAAEAHFLLPYALAATGDFERGAASARAGAPRVGRGRRTQLLAFAGEAAGAHGDLAGARAAFELAAQAYAEKPEERAEPPEDREHFEDPPPDPAAAAAARLRSAAGMRTRAAHVGETAPPLPAAKWVGAAPRDPSKPGDRATLVVHVNTTKCWRCRATLADLVHWQSTYGERGLDVVVLAEPTDSGFLVKHGASPFAGSEQVFEGAAEQLGHLTTYRERIGAAYPIGLVEDEASPYTAFGHAAWLVGRDGKVAAFPGTFWYRPTQEGTQLFPGSLSVLRASLERALPALPAQK